MQEKAMETCTIVFSIINAIGSLATAITLIIALTKFSRKLKVKGEFPIKNSGTYLLSIYNNTLYDNEIKGVFLCKGNPLNLLTDNYSIYHTINFEEYGLTINPNTKNAIIHKDSCIEIPIPCKCIACNYKTIGEAIGKPFDKIYILVKDKRGKSYCVNTGANVDFFKILGQQEENS